MNGDAEARAQRLRLIADGWKGGNHGAITTDDIDWLITEVGRLYEAVRQEPQARDLLGMVLLSQPDHRVILRPEIIAGWRPAEWALEHWHLQNDNTEAYQLVPVRDGRIVR